MTIYLVGHEFGSLTAIDSNTFESTDAGGFDATYGRCALKCHGNTTVEYSPMFTALSEGYVHKRWRQSVTIGLPGVQTYLFGSSGGQIRVLVNNDTIKAQYSVGSTWVDATSASAISSTVLTDYDLYWKVGASGRLRLYTNGTLFADSGVIDLSSITNINQIGGSGTQPLVDQYHSEIIVADEPTIGWRLGTLYLTGAGTTNTFTAGTYADVDETVCSDADGLTSDTAAQVFTGACNDLAPAGFVIRGVGVAARARKGATGPANLQLALRTGGANYFSASQALDVGYGGFVSVWATNPGTAVAWTAADIAALEIGVKSIA